MSAPILRALGGAPLEGRRIVRFVFTDEGGISRYEPFVVVAGVFVHGDNQLVPLEEELERLMHRHIPRELHRDFVFHATDIWSGTGKIFSDKNTWTPPRRMKILRDLARVPKKLDIPIIHEAVKRANLDFSKEEAKVGRKMTASEASIAAHAIAFTACTLRIEQFMRIRWRKEVAQMVAEDNDQVRALVKGAHDLFQNPSKADGEIIPNNILPIRKIRGSVHFATKTESKPLQLADICAFLIRGYLAGRHPQHNGPLYSKIRPMLLMPPNGDAYTGPPITAAPPYGGFSK